MHGYSKIPEHMRKGLQRYVEEGIRPGDFLYHILINDFVHAAGYADEENQQALLAYARTLYCDLPSGCWGSKDKVEAWISSRQQAQAG